MSSNAPIHDRRSGRHPHARFGIDTVFGLPGIQLDPLFDALYGQRQSIRTFHTRHEQGSAYMALGYAQASGKVGVFAVVPGPALIEIPVGERPSIWGLIQRPSSAG